MLWKQNARGRKNGTKEGTNFKNTRCTSTYDYCCNCIALRTCDCTARALFTYNSNPDTNTPKSVSRFWSGTPEEVRSQAPASLIGYQPLPFGWRPNASFFVLGIVSVFKTRSDTNSLAHTPTLPPLHPNPGLSTVHPERLQRKIGPRV